MMRFPINISTKFMMLVCTILMTMTALLGNASSAQAGDLEIMFGSNFQYWVTDQSIAYGLDDENHYDYNFLGFNAYILPEFRVNDWFAVGLELGAGAQYTSTKPKDLKEDIVDDMFNFDILATFRFIKKFEHIELWAEIGIGTALNSITDDSLIYYNNDSNQPSERTNFALKTRLRLGFTILFTQHFGIGIDASSGFEFYDWGPTLQTTDSHLQYAIPVNSGLHCLIRF